MARPPAVGGVGRHPGITRRAKRARSCGPGAMASWPLCGGRSTTGGPTGFTRVRHPRSAHGWPAAQGDPAVLPLWIATPKAAPASQRPHRGARRASYRGDRDVAGPTHTEPGRAGKGGNIRKAPHHTREVDPDVAIGFCVIRDRTISTQRRSLEVPQDDAGPLRSTRCPNVTTSSVTPPATTPSSASSAGLATTASGPAVCAQPSITTSTA